MRKCIRRALLLGAMGALLALSFYLFIQPNRFAPAGLGGVGAMVQYRLGISLGWFTLWANLPLCLLAFFKLDRGFALASLWFVLVYSFSLVVFQQGALSAWQYHAQDRDTVYPALISGVISGFVYAQCLKQNSSTGGTDILSRWVVQKHPQTNFFVATFLFNALVAVASVPVYAQNGAIDYKPAAMCLVYCFVSNWVGNALLEGTRTAYQFLLITREPQELTRAICGLGHTTTCLYGTGGYTGEGVAVLVCVVNRHRVAAMQRLLRQFPATFASCSVVKETFGNFHRNKK